METHPPQSRPLKSAYVVFVKLFLSGRSKTDAYLGAGYQCTRAAAAVGGHRLSHRADIKQVIDAARLATLRKLHAPASG